MDEISVAKTVADLRTRARRAERKSILFISVLGTIAAAAIGFILFLLFSARKEHSATEASYVESFFQRMLDAGFSSNDIERVTQELSQLVQQDYTSLFVNVIFSLGTVGFTVLLIQIAGNFIRYYARLAELYHSQADSLELAAGNVEDAAKYASMLSPNAIEFGKTPISIYERALDTVAEVAKSSKG